MLQESSSRTRSLENRKSVTKLLTETTADPVKEDDQASDFGDFEEDDPRPKKWLVFKEIFFFMDTNWQIVIANSKLYLTTSVYTVSVYSVL